ncbi:hypothetical protein AVEN_15985-1 [Araneus ventricosus]|uniref:Uncharacterized protein n=1 Tax=Araneus ventricosus TaxID=182803 RepID=A0A4Y2RRR5_ARAVE|nr:hypothetical protein AVEN_15985-1 [Araneus ventricosus]
MDSHNKELTVDKFAEMLQQLAFFEANTSDTDPPEKQITTANVTEGLVSIGKEARQQSLAGRVSAWLSEDSRFETRFHEGSDVYVNLVNIKSAILLQTTSRSCGMEIPRSVELHQDKASSHRSESTANILAVESTAFLEILEKIEQEMGIKKIPFTAIPIRSLAAHP